MKTLLSELQRERILQSMSDEQRSYIEEHIRLDRRSMFANELAYFKSDQQWELIDFIDAGEISELKCQCGRRLRRQYIVQNSATGEIIKLGSTHFEEHTGIPKSIASQVKKEIHKIQYDLDELLSKFEKQQLSKGLIASCKEFEVEIPESIDGLNELELPILDRHIDRLEKMLLDKAYEQQDFIQKHKEGIQTKKKSKQGKQIDEQDSEDVEGILSHRDDFNLVKMIERDSLSVQVIGGTISEEAQNEILSYISGDSMKFTTLEICHHLIKNRYIGKERYSTGRPKSHPYVSMFIESLPFVELKEKSWYDRIYTKRID
ncbi:DUF3895 domain-containing protein [Bacillus cereus]|uniref:DUF3895 domain-containing protein n=1 Tax=Bacillus cereus TaxID=1396 RepID=A0A161TLK2_BACCE|nr:DUF3895 domain-containing protein [Bacillus cereus]KZD48694.1 hypothetical protein B4088_6622 [Bacillus cereus]